MNDNTKTMDVTRKLGAGRFSSQIRQGHKGLGHELQKYMHILGPMPRCCLATLADLGLSDPEIARYFKMPEEVVTDLRELWQIEGLT